MEPPSPLDSLPQTGSGGTAPSHGPNHALAAAVRTRLASDGTITLPRLGTLRLRHEPARVETDAEGHRMLLPPRQGVAFEHDFDSGEDGGAPLLQAFARHLGQPVEAARAALDQLLDAFLDQLDADGEAALDGVGHLARGDAGLNFEPDSALVAAVSAPFAGLAPIASTRTSDAALSVPSDPEDDAPALAAPAETPTRPFGEDEDAAPGLDGEPAPTSALPYPAPPSSAPGGDAFSLDPADTVAAVETSETPRAPLPSVASGAPLSEDDLAGVLDDLDRDLAPELPSVPEAPLRDLVSEVPRAPIVQDDISIADIVEPGALGDSTSGLVEEETRFTDAIEGDAERVIEREIDEIEFETFHSASDKVESPGPDVGADADAEVQDAEKTDGAASSAPDDLREESDEEPETDDEDALDTLLEGVWAPSSPPDPDHPLGPDTAPVIEDAEFDVVDDQQDNAATVTAVDLHNVEPIDDTEVAAEAEVDTPDVMEHMTGHEASEGGPAFTETAPNDAPLPEASVPETVGDELAALIASAVPTSSSERSLDDTLPGEGALAENEPTEQEPFEPHEAPVAPAVAATSSVPASAPVASRLVAPTSASSAFAIPPAVPRRPAGAPPRNEGTDGRVRTDGRLRWLPLLLLGFAAILALLLWPRLFGGDRDEAAGLASAETQPASEAGDTFATLDPNLEGAGGVAVDDDTAEDEAASDLRTDATPDAASSAVADAPADAPAEVAPETPTAMGAGAPEGAPPVAPAPAGAGQDVAEAGIPLPLRGPGRVDPARGGATWILGSGDRAGAEQDAARLRRLGYKASVLTGQVRGRTVHRVAVGQFTTYEDALQFRSALPPGTPAGAWVLRLS